jgi:hypothetical protein
VAVEERMSAKLIEDDLTILGLKFRHKKDAREQLASQLRAKPLKVDLWREPDNKYDENAVMIVGAEDEWDGVHLGYLGRETAAILAPRFDAGTLATIEAELVNLKEPDFNAGTVHVVFEDSREVVT